MVNQYSILRVLLFITALLCSACVSSEETGSNKGVRGPQSGPTAVDSAKMLARADSLAKADFIRAKRGGFTSKQDTVLASVVKKSKSGRTIKKIERPPNPAYTVQIGAFARTKYALAIHKLAKERFAELPVFNVFEPFDKLYRVQIGKYDTRKQADSLRKAILKQYPEEYNGSWINYISK
ncbi:MAG: SPOR domain-containing protein [Ignavibacteriales bacterium]|nr:SPOR domain-containing protein [Ignavibacteriales bacterium]